MVLALIFSDEPDWHTRRLTAAFRGRGAETHVRSLHDCVFAVGGDGPGIVIPGLLPKAMPDVVLARTIAAGSFEQVTLRLSFLHALSHIGIPVINSARTIERCVDKSMTSFLLHRAGIPTPSTLITEEVEAATRYVEQAGGDLVIKPLFGSQGKGLARLSAGASLPPSDAYAGIHYLQRFVGRDKAWRDFRVMVVGGRAVAAMARHGQSWITNVARGAQCERITLTPRLADLSIAAAEVVGADYAGVDLIEDEHGSLLVLEINSSPAWKGLQSVAHHDISDLVAEHALRRIA
jgi:tetrahydromethanopterin:alpha-L-glutamate ligase